MSDMLEEAPITITMRNINKLFDTKDGTSLVDLDRALLGIAFEDYYEYVGDAFWTRIRLCVTQNQRKTYPQSYRAAERVYNAFFTIDGGKHQKAQELRSHIFSAWQKRLENTCSGYSKAIQYFMSDNTLRSSQADSVKEFRAFLDMYQTADDINDKSDLLTVFTLLSITRGKWNLLSPEDILPKAYQERKPITKSSKENNPYTQAKKLYEKKNYSGAIGLLENLGKTHVEVTDNEKIEEYRRFNSKVFYLLSSAYRKQREKYNTKDPKYLELTNDIQYALEEAIHNNCVKAMLEAARDFFNGHPNAVFDENHDDCIKLCQKIINTDYEAKECGEAFWMLYCLEEDKKAAAEYLKKSAAYSYPKAVKEWNEREAVSLIHVIGKSSDDSDGVFYLNDRNLCSELIYKTAPKNWERKKYPFDQNGTDNDSEPALEINLSGQQKYFLISDNYNRNLKELLHLLQVIKESSTPITDKQIEFFIRGNEDEISPFIDTVLARIPNCIPVHILDDNKMSARVLAQHPLFYSIRNLRKDKPAHLNFVVIGNTPCCEWLIREASWMLTFRNPNITAKIIVLAPDAEKVIDKIHFQCPGIKTYNKSKNSFLEIKPLPCDFQSSDLISKVENITNGGNAYYVIDTASDTLNAALAIKVREVTIREKIRVSDDELVPEFPVVAFHCQDPDIANLTHRSIVINESFGYEWFNNYALIPFGSAAQQYHWNALTDNILDKLSLNVHLQYYLNKDFDIPSNPDTYESLYSDALKSFWRRTYNRDSCMAVAMSLPYRLYQGLIKEKPILPVGPDPLNHERLNILDDDTFYSEEARNAYSFWVKESNWATAQYMHEIEQRHQTPYKVWSEIVVEENPESEIYQLAEWEHKRWNNFMISRGWTSAEINQMKLYFEEGNKRQQLYIGRMHPCIIPFDKISTLDNAWNSLIHNEQSFKQSDISTIRMTEHILELKWTKAAEEYFKSKKSEVLKQE